MYDACKLFFKQKGALQLRIQGCAVALTLFKTKEFFLIALFIMFYFLSRFLYVMLMASQLRK